MKNVFSKIVFCALSSLTAENFTSSSSLSTSERDTYLVVAKRAMQQPQEKQTKNKVRTLSVGPLYSEPLSDNEPEPNDALDELSAEITDFVESSPHCHGRDIEKVARKILSQSQLSK